MVTERDDYQVMMSIYDEAETALDSVFILYECLSLLREDFHYVQCQQACFAVEMLDIFISVLEKRLESIVRDSCFLVQNATYE